MTRARQVVTPTAVLIAALLANPSSSAASDNTELDQALEAGAAYVTTFADAFSGLVAEEDYSQTVTPFGRSPSEPLARRTRSDIVFVGMPGPIRWSCFRDVFDVNGEEVRDRKARLERLFIEGGLSALQEAAAIRAESARFNIGLPRTVNDPALPLMFLLRENQQRFAFSAHGYKDKHGVRALELGFEENGEPTLVMEDGRPNLLSRGRLWIEPRTGVVVRTELELKSKLTTLDALISVEYEPFPDLSIWVPARMIEVYPGMRAEAQYENYRRFMVHTMEAIGLPPAEEATP